MQKLIIILNNIRSRENVGSIFRTADAAGVNKVYLCGITPTPPHEKISKTALGAETYVPWEYRKQAWRLLLELKAITTRKRSERSSNPRTKRGEQSSYDGRRMTKKEGINIVALEQTKESVDLFKFKSQLPLALVVGNEVNGLSPQILKYCDKKVFIPMHGKKESLNVSVATGIAMFQLIK